MTLGGWTALTPQSDLADGDREHQIASVSPRTGM